MTAPPPPDELTLDVAVEDDGWQGVLDEAAARGAVAAALAEGREGGAAEVSLLLTSDEDVRALNRDWRGKDRPTNVLSFPAPPEATLPGAPRALGDMALALGTVVAEAGAAGLAPRDHALHLIVHGTFHLLGYSHEHDEEAARMEALEVAALARLGLPDPYALRSEEMSAAPSPPKAP